MFTKFLTPIKKRKTSCQYRS